MAPHGPAISICRRREFTCAALLTLSLSLWVDLAHAGPEVVQREEDLREALLDTAALLRTGINFNQLRDRMPELNIKFDRYVRSGGQPYGSLFKVVESLRELEADWAEGNKHRVEAVDYPPEYRFKVDQLVAESRQRHFGYVIAAIERYEEERKASLDAEKQAAKKRARK